MEFQVVSLFALSVQALHAKRGSKFGFFETWEKRKWRMRRKKVKGRRTYRPGFAVVVCILTEVWICVCCFCVWSTRKINWLCLLILCLVDKKDLLMGLCLYFWISRFVIFGF